MFLEKCSGFFFPLWFLIFCSSPCHLILGLIFFSCFSFRFSFVCFNLGLKNPLWFLIKFCAACFLKIFSFPSIVPDFMFFSLSFSFQFWGSSCFSFLFFVCLNSRLTKALWFLTLLCVDFLFKSRVLAFLFFSLSFNFGVLVFVFQFEVEKCSGS